MPCSCCQVSFSKCRTNRKKSSCCWIACPNRMKSVLSPKICQPFFFLLHSFVKYSDHGIAVFCFSVAFFFFSEFIWKLTKLNNLWGSGLRCSFSSRAASLTAEVHFYFSLCLLSASCRLARGRDEWESASLQNANTRCNGLMPVWGPQVSIAT